MSWEQDEGEEFEHVEVEAPDGTRGVASFPRVERTPMPEGLLGVLFPGERGFIGVNCLTEADNIDNPECTTVFDYDEWFTGEICTRCHRLTPPGRR